MRRFILLSIILLSSILLPAQNPVLPFERHNVHHDSIETQSAPLDGGLSILMFLGAVYGIKKVYHFKKNSKNK